MKALFSIIMFTINLIACAFVDLAVQQPIEWGVNMLISCMGVGVFLLITRNT